VKGAFDPVTIDKIQVLGSNFLPKVLESIDLDQIPEFLGGGCKCGCVPKAGPFENIIEEDETKKKTEVTVAAGSIHDHILNAEQKSKIFWEFNTVSHDIAFGVYYKQSDYMYEILPMDRVNSSEESVQGHHVCEEGGEYILRWDNSYSKLRKKTIIYQCFVEEPPKKRKKKKKKKSKKKKGGQKSEES